MARRSKVENKGRVHKRVATSTHKFGAWLRIIPDRASSSSSTYSSTKVVTSHHASKICNSPRWRYPLLQFKMSYIGVCALVHSLITARHRPNCKARTSSCKRPKVLIRPARGFRTTCFCKTIVSLLRVVDTCNIG